MYFSCKLIDNGEKERKRHDLALGKHHRARGPVASYKMKNKVVSCKKKYELDY